MTEIKCTGITDQNGVKVREGDKVEVTFWRQGGGASPEKITEPCTYVNGSFMIGHLHLHEIIENNAQVPHKHPMYIKVINPTSL